jgi:hypothetical protein
MRLRLMTFMSGIVLSACQEATPPTANEPGWIKLTGTRSFEASGSPAFEGQTIVPSTFAVAIADSVAGAYILAFNQKGADRGDFFVLAVNARRAGTFGPCGERARIHNPDGSTLTLPGPCGGHLTENVAVFDGMASSSTGHWQIVDGTVVVENADRRLIGSVANLRLDGFSADSRRSGPVLITEGSFDLPLLTGKAAARMTYCFVEEALNKQCQM